MENNTQEIIIDPNEMSEEELIQTLQSLAPSTEESSSDDLVVAFDPIEFSDEKNTELVNLKEFIQGESIGARLAGMYTVLVNSGVPIKTSSDLIVNQMTLEHNFNLQLEMNKTSIEVAKHQGLMTKQQTL